MARRRLDAELVRRGLAPSREAARAAVAAGLVTVDGIPATKPGTMVGGDAPVRLVEAAHAFVSRGGGKLEAALDRFGVPVEGLICLDAGASTGGFTDCLLRRGAAHVYAVDVGYGQLAWTLRNDPRVTVMERTNVRLMTPRDLPEPPALIVADLSFVSLRSILPALFAFAPSELIVLVKPQFESDPADVGPGGVVRDPQEWRRALTRVVGAAESLDGHVAGIMASPLPGPSGNVEFLVYLRREATAVRAEHDLDHAIAEGEELRV